MTQRLTILIIFIALSIITTAISIPYIRQTKEGLIWRIKMIDKNYFGNLTTTQIYNKFKKEDLQKILETLKSKK